jgi:hypothetical protein
MGFRVTITCLITILAFVYSSQAESKLVVPKQGVYTGAYIDFGDREDKVTFDSL